MGAQHPCAAVCLPIAGSQNYSAFAVAHGEAEIQALGEPSHGEVLSSLAEERHNHRAHRFAELPPSARSYVAEDRPNGFAEAPEGGPSGGTCVAGETVAVAAAAGRFDLIHIPVAEVENSVENRVAEIENTVVELADFGADFGGFGAVVCGFAEVGWFVSGFDDGPMEARLAAAAGVLLAGPGGASVAGGGSSAGGGREGGREVGREGGRGRGGGRQGVLS